MNPQAPGSDLPERPPEDVRAWLSALADGEADLHAADGACAAWRNDPGAREVWHRYHVIGDVLRSAELAGPAPRDAAFLTALRAKLAAEPVVLAPAPVAQASARSTGRSGWAWANWRAPAAVAAGFVAVAGVLMVMRPGAGSGPESGSLQVRAPAAPGLVLTAVPSGGSNPVSSGALIRDPHLDAYLSAHRAARGGGMAVVPGGALRQVEGVVPVSVNR